MHDQEKRQLRKLKRDIKKLGSKHRRRKLKDDLRDNPADAHLAEEDVGKLASETLNGMDKDSTRRRE